MGPGGALEAAVEARDQGLTRFIGVTGHGLTVAAMHLRSLERFDFDSVLLPYNFVMMQNPEYAAGFNRLVEVCRERNVAVQTIKSIARRPWGQTIQNRTMWYEPFIDQADIDRSVHWALGNENVFLNTAADSELLPKVLDAASRFTARPSDEEMQSALESFGMETIFPEAHE
jgi:predicted aldo/keto reductase-like oxidoreductase